MENGCSSFICILITGKQTNVHSVLVIEQSESDSNVFFLLCSYHSDCIHQGMICNLDLKFCRLKHPASVLPKY